MHALAGTAFLALVTLFFLYTAWSSATEPQAFACRLGLTIKDAGGVNEIRSQYAGFFLAAAAICLLSLLGVLPALTALTVLTMIFGGLIAGRLLSLLLNRGLAGFGPAILALYVINGVGFLIAAALTAAERAA